MFSNQCELKKYQQTSLNFYYKLITIIYRYTIPLSSLSVKYKSLLNIHNDYIHHSQNTRTFSPQLWLSTLLHLQLAAELLSFLIMCYPIETSTLQLTKVPPSRPHPPLRHIELCRLHRHLRLLGFVSLSRSDFSFRFSFSLIY